MRKLERRFPPFGDSRVQSSSQAPFGRRRHDLCVGASRSRTHNVDVVDCLIGAQPSMGRSTPAQVPQTRLAWIAAGEPLRLSAQ